MFVYSQNFKLRGVNYAYVSGKVSETKKVSSQYVVCVFWLLGVERTTLLYFIHAYV